MTFALAALALAPLFADHAVLQQGKAIPVWGTAPAGETVTVAFAGQRAAGLADAHGDWMAYLEPLAASAESRDLTVSGAHDTVTVHDVLVGEVWLASGQSNMEFVVSDAPGRMYHVLNEAAEVAAAQYPLLRHFKIAHHVSTTPAGSAGGAWQICSPATVSQFSAVAYFFARELQQRLQVPLGIVNCSWGGTPVEAWMSPLALARQPLPHPHPSPGHPRDSWTVSGLYDGMVNPTAPYGLRGFIWYQGESNADMAGDYHALFSALVRAWREHFGQGDLPFYWVQLANYTIKTDPTDQTWAELRAQQEATLDLPNTGEVVTLDIGDPTNIHPHNKQEVGRRLALLAKAEVYGIPGDVSGPVFAGAAVEGSAMRVRFRFADNGLIAAGRPPQSFEIAGADHRYFPAVATLAGSTVIVRSPRVPHPVAVRYAWRNNPDANLFNGAGLPAAPFDSGRQ